MLSKDWESFEKSDIAWWRVINICRDSLSVFFALPIGIAHHRTYIQWRLCRLPLADLLLYNRSCCISMDVSVQLVGASCRASRRTESLMKQKLPWIHCVVWHIVYRFGNIHFGTKLWMIFFSQYVTSRFTMCKIWVFFWDNLSSDVNCRRNLFYWHFPIRRTSQLA